MERARAAIRNRVVRVGMLGAAVVGTVALLASGGSNEACASTLKDMRAVAAAAVNFGGVEVKGIQCPPSDRGVNVEETGVGFRHVQAADTAGTDIRGSGINLGGTGDTGFIAVPMQYNTVVLRAEDQQKTVLGQTTVEVACVGPTTSLAPTTSSSPVASIPGGEQGKPVGTTTIQPAGSTTTSTAVAPRTSISVISGGEQAGSVTSSTAVFNVVPPAGDITTTTSVLGAGVMDSSVSTILQRPALTRTC